MKIHFVLFWILVLSGLDAQEVGEEYAPRSGIIYAASEKGEVKLYMIAGDSRARRLASDYFSNGKFGLGVFNSLEAIVVCRPKGIRKKFEDLIEILVSNAKGDITVYYVVDGKIRADGKLYNLHDFKEIAAMVKTRVKKVEEGVEEGVRESAGINRLGIENERVLQRKPSQ